MPLDRNLPIPDLSPAPPLAKRLAYGGSPQSPDTHFSYRLERGQPFLRTGKLVTVLPQFKGLTIYSPVNSNSPTGAFQTTVNPVSVTYPARTK